MKFLFFLVGLCAPLLLQAQAPGYLGKKNIIQANFSSSLAFVGPTYNNRGIESYGSAETSIVGVNTKYGFGFNRTIGRLSAISVGFDQSQTAYIVDLETPSIAFDDLGYGDRDQHNCFIRANVAEYYIGLRLFRGKKGAISPLGRYFMPKVGFVRTTSRMVDRNTDFGWNSSKESIAPLALNENLNYYMLGFGSGLNMVLADKIIINFSLEASYYFNKYTFETVSGATYQLDNQTEQGKKLGGRLGRQSLVLFRIGLGYLF